MRASCFHHGIFLYSWSLFRVDCHLDPKARFEPWNLVFEVDDRAGISVMYKMEIVITSCSPAGRDVTFIISISLQPSTVVFSTSLCRRGYMIEGESWEQKTKLKFGQSIRSWQFSAICQEWAGTKPAGRPLLVLGWKCCPHFCVSSQIQHGHDSLQGLWTWSYDSYPPI